MRGWRGEVAHILIGDLVALGGFLALVMLGLEVMRTRRSVHGEPPRALHAFIAVALGMTLLPGVTQRELWPFANWKLMAHVTPPVVSTIALTCVDSAGVPFAIDHRAWSPITEEELIAWMNTEFPRRDSAGQDSARAFLLRSAEDARQRARAGRHPALRPSPIGALAASSHLLHPDRWTSTATTPETPCAALRLVYREWNVVEVAAGRDSVRETTRWQYPAAR